MKHIRKFNESFDDSSNPTKVVFSGETKNGWKYSVVSNDGELELARYKGEDSDYYVDDFIDAGEMMHEAVDAYLDGDSRTESFLIDIMDIAEAYDKKASLE